MKRVIKKSLILASVIFLCVLYSAPAAIHAQAIVSIEVTPESGEIPALGQTIQYTATAIYDDDSEVDVTDTATWDIDDPGIATNDDGGQFTGVSSGDTQVGATFGGVTGNAGLWVDQGYCGLETGSPGESTYFYPYATGCAGLSWELVVTDDSSTEVFTASGTIPSDEWSDNQLSTVLSAGDYTLVFSIDGTEQQTLDFSIWGFESSFDISVGYAGKTTTFTLTATNSSGKRAFFYLVDTVTPEGTIIYDEEIPIGSDDWTYTINQTLAAGDYWAGFWVEDYWVGGYEFSVVKKGKPKPPVKEKPEPEKHKAAGPAINEKSLSSYEKTTSGFTTLFYNRLLKRSPEKSGLDSWMARLKNGEITGSDLVRKFIFGKECQTIISDYTDSEFITFLYKALFNREASTENFDAWLARMSAGMTREEVVDSFTHSEEFINICKEFGIIPYEGYINNEG